VPGVQSVERAFTVLRCLAGGPAGVSALAERAGLPKSTVSRLLGTLQALGAVEQVGAASEYRIGHGMIDLAAAALPGRNLISVARPHLVELVDVLGEAAGLAVLDVDDVVVYLDQVNVDNPVQVRDWTGERIRPHMVSSGLVLLAHQSPEERERYLAGPLEAVTPRTTTEPAALRRRLDGIVARGTEWTIDEFVPGISSVAAPVTDPSGHVVAAVHAHGPSYRFPPPGGAVEVAGVVAGAARRISARLGPRSSVGDEPD
jgi:IclR family acetate operon transcriptional repressor